MNFLSHYHFYRSADTYYNVGLVLPDLVRNICKTHIKLSTSYVNEPHTFLAKGSHAHLEGDRIFHQSRFFNVCQSYISERLDPTAAWPRKWFLNHLLLEIALDRVLMEQHPLLCKDFYNDLELADVDNLTSFLQISKIPDTSLFAPGYQRFVSFPFIFDYMHNEKIILALSRVYSRIGIDYQWSKTDKHTLMSELPGILDFISGQVANLEQELH
jgi:hypothetical protein